LKSDTTAYNSRDECGGNGVNEAKLTEATLHRAQFIEPKVKRAKLWSRKVINPKGDRAQR